MKWLKQIRNRRLERRIAELQAELDASQRRLAVTEVERDTLAAVVVRERSRVEAETAIHKRRQAEAEGMTNDDRTDYSIRKFSA